MAGIIHFGTDGWRGRIAEDYTFDNVRCCAQGFAEYLIGMGYRDQWVVVGYDRRFHSENFAKSAAEVLAANGLRVYLTDKETPTPTIAYSVLDKKAVGAVNITASHNPSTDNGFKVRDSQGGAIAPSGLEQIEAHIPASAESVRRMPLQQALSERKVVLFDPAPAYIEQLGRMVNLERLRNAGLRVLVEPMWGNGSGWFPRILGGGSTQVEEIHKERNPIFPEILRPEPIPPNIDVGLAETVKRGADVLLITDGDADRCGVGDEKGVFIDQLRVYALLAYYLLELRGQRGPIVKTLSTTGMLDKLAKMYNVPVYETGVGFKYVAPKFIETHAMIGGEESGGYAFQGHVPERDGILGGLFILDMMVQLKRTPSQLIDVLFSKVGAHYYDRVDRSFTGDRKEREKLILSANAQTMGGLKVMRLETFDGFKYTLEDGGFLLIRFSGTEPIMRVYTETTHPECVKDILQDGLKVAGLQ